jgi:hypothetical protein
MELQNLLVTIGTGFQFDVTISPLRKPRWLMNLDPKVPTDHLDLVDQVLIFQVTASNTITMKLEIFPPDRFM